MTEERNEDFSATLLQASSFVCLCIPAVVGVVESVLTAEVLVISPTSRPQPADISANRGDVNYSLQR